MLATLVIGLREGLEAALIVGIIAAFLRKNGKSLVPMWIGVAIAVALSILVGVGLSLVEQALPQAAQEAMESIIGAVAIVFVTGMIVWMNTHSRGMKKELEHEAEEALSQGGAYALAVMAFLAVLKEGFETSVFLLATFSAAQSASLAATGAVIGVLIAVAIGWGIYAGGVRLNLARFFRATGAFLILVAGGLVITALRTAHEAGWLNAGQQSTVSLSWLVQPGTVQSALITGVLGIPADPRLIEVIGWFAYLVPVALYVYWPASLRPRGIAVVRMQFGIAAGLAVVGAVLAVAVPVPSVSPSASAAVIGESGAPAGTARISDDTFRYAGTRLPLAAASGKNVEHAGVAAREWTRNGSSPAVGRPATLTLTQLVGLSGGRLPIGVNASENPGPYAAAWKQVDSVSVWTTRDGALLDAAGRSDTVLTLSGGGLTSSRVLTVASGTADANGAWSVDPRHPQAVAAELAAVEQSLGGTLLFKLFLPVALGLAALILALFALRGRLRRRTAPPPTAPQPTAPTDGATSDQTPHSPTAHNKEYETWQA